MDKKQVKMSIEEIQNTYATAKSEFTKQCGYIEGALDTLIAMIMDTAPEVSIAADKLVKAFHNIEGICSQGIFGSFIKMQNLSIALSNEIAEKKAEADKTEESSTKLDYEEAKKLLAKSKGK